MSNGYGYRKGSFNQSSLKKYNPLMIELARRAGSMQDLSREMGISVQMAHSWARGVDLPDFRSATMSERYLRADAHAVQVVGCPLAEIFGQSDEPVDPADPPAPNIPWDQAINLRIDLQRILNRLSPRDRAILSLHAEGATFSDLAEGFGLTRERMRQIHLRAMNRARKLLKNHGGKI